jgi:hypothetical protein
MISFLEFGFNPLKLSDQHTINGDDEAIFKVLLTWLKNFLLEGCSIKTGQFFQQLL